MKILSRLRDVKNHLEAKSGDIVELKVEVDKLKAEKYEMQALLHSSGVEKDTEIQMLATELSESSNEVVSLKQQLEDLRSQYKEIGAELSAEKEKRDEMDAQLMKVTTARLEERVAKDAANTKLGEATRKSEEAESWVQAFWRLRREMKKLHATLKDAKSQVKTKSDALLELEKKVGEVTEQNESLRSQLDKQHVEEVAVKEEELTDNEDVMARMKKRGTAQDVTILKAKVDFAVSEVQKREVELDEARDKIEELSAENQALSAENKELHRQVQFKVKWSSRSRPSTSTRDSLHSLEGTTYTL